MKPKRTSAAEALGRQAQVGVRVTIVTLDSHLASATERAQHVLLREIPGLRLSLHAASEWDDPAALDRCKADIAQADIVFVTMMFMDDHIQAVLPALLARRDQCDAMVCCMSAAEVAKLTRMGRFDMSKPATGALALLKRLRGKSGAGGDGKTGTTASRSAGAQQLKMLRMLPRILRFVPGTAQDVRAYFLTLQYWLAGSDDNVANLVRLLIDRYAAGPRAALHGTLPARPPAEYPEVGVYHPRMKGRINASAAALPRLAHARGGTVGVLVMRSYLLAGNSQHYDGVIAALEARGLNVIPAFSSGLDARPAVEQFFMKDGRSTIDALVSLTGFSLVGGPAYNDARAAEELLAALDVPYVAAHPVEFQSLPQWATSERGLLPVESTIMVAIPELDGATGSMVIGGRGVGAEGRGSQCTGCARQCRFEQDARDMAVCTERVDVLAARVAKLAALRRGERARRKVAAVLFNFPPNSGATGTAAFLSVFESLHRLMGELAAQGYSVEVPASVEALRERVLEGNARRYGQQANVHLRVAADEHVRRERHLAEIERAWGPAPGKQQSDGAGLFILGERFGNLFVGIQPAFGYEGDPMRLLFEKGFAPTHAFSAFYRFIREDFGADAVLHFGTHGALEFMPGKQTGLSAACWPDRLIGDLPNFYLYAANNPSEGTIAKRRSAATLVSYMTPPIAQAGLYRGLADLKASIDQWRQLEIGDGPRRADLAALIQAQAAAVELASLEPSWTLDDGEADTQILRLTRAVIEVEQTLIPYGLHVVGQAPRAEERTELLAALAEAELGHPAPRAAIDVLVRGGSGEQAAALDPAAGGEEGLAKYRGLATTHALLAQDHELPALVHALDGRFVRPAPGGDLLRRPDMLPTGRNLHGFDPFRIPSAWAMLDGARQTERLLERHVHDGHALPESVALVLWGTDNLKTEGGPIGQALCLMGARPRFDSYGRLAGAALLPLAELGRPRIDVVMTLSGIFRDLLPLQVRMLAEAAFLAASADEPPERNYVRKHALAYAARHGCDLETASLRVFSNADGAYGANVNHMIENGRWDDEDELAETYTRRKCFAYGRNGKPQQQSQLLGSMLGDVELTYQNLDSVEVGVTSVDHYFDTLGGISRAVKRVRKQAVPVYISDQTDRRATVRTLAEQVALETRTRTLNPKWYEGMLEHGYEGVRQIEVQVTNTMGWSATTQQVAPWVYQQITQTFVLDKAMRERLAQLNPVACAKVAQRLIEAHERQYWSPDEATLRALREAGDELDDRVEGIGVEAGAAARIPA
ncbi:MAG: magnesium chelatase subunit H [Betaproteobacteria bacterium]|jgi:magnesium chelatase subunit H